MQIKDDKTYTEKEIESARHEIKRVFIRSLIFMLAFLGLAAGYFILIMAVKSQKHGIGKLEVRLIMLPFLILLLIGMRALANVIACIINLRRIKKLERSGRVVYDIDQDEQNN